MTGKEDNVGFLTTGSEVKQFQLSLWGYFVPRCLFFVATPARPASLPKSCFSETYEVPARMFGREKLSGSWAARTGDKQDHVRLTARRGCPAVWRIAGVLLLAVYPSSPTLCA